MLCEAMEFCKEKRISILLVSELSRLGRNAFEVLASVKELIDCGINLYIQKEQLTLLDDEGHPSLFAPIMIATLSTCAQLEPIRDVAKLSGKGVSTVQRVKQLLKVQSPQ